MKHLSKEKESECRSLDKASKLPEKMRHQTDILISAVNSLKTQVEAVHVKLKEKDGALWAPKRISMSLSVSTCLLSHTCGL